MSIDRQTVEILFALLLALVGVIGALTYVWRKNADVRLKDSEARLLAAEDKLKQTVTDHTVVNSLMELFAPLIRELSTSTSKIGDILEKQGGGISSIGGKVAESAVTIGLIKDDTGSIRDLIEQSNRAISDLTASIDSKVIVAPDALEKLHQQIQLLEQKINAVLEKRKTGDSQPILPLSDIVNGQKP